MTRRTKMSNKKWNKMSRIKTGRIKIGGIKISGMKIGEDPWTLGGGDPPSVSAKRSQWNKKWNKN